MALPPANVLITTNIQTRRWDDVAAFGPFLLSVPLRNRGDGCLALPIRITISDYYGSCSCKDSVENIHSTLSRDKYELHLACKTTSAVWKLIDGLNSNLQSSGLSASFFPSVDWFYELRLYCEHRSEICDKSNLLRTFTPRWKSPLPPTRRKINSKVVRAIGQPISFKNHEAKRGSVYILRSPSAPGHCKIGVSYKYPQTRLDQWRRCIPDAELIAFSYPRVPCAGRLETLVHAELCLYRKKDHCGRCKRGNRVAKNGHTEWFEVSEVQAKRAVERWAKWIASQPYDTVTGELCAPWLEKLYPSGNKKPCAKEVLTYEPGIDGTKSMLPSWQTWTEWRSRCQNKDLSGSVYIKDFHETMLNMDLSEPPTPVRKSIEVDILRKE